jgi:putative Mg2+ transporter-C (MgtC) family protein
MDRKRTRFAHPFYGVQEVQPRRVKPEGNLEMGTFLGEPMGQTWLQLAELGLAFVLSAAIGLERELRQKSAGLRTYTLVGFSSALIILISKYGFTDIIQQDRIVLDPSRIAAQVVSGIGFIGGGVIFVRKDLVRGLTTAATIWLTAAVGMACGAGLPILAIAVTVAHFVVIAGFPAIERRLPKSRWAAVSLRISYWDGRGILREVLAISTQQDFSISRLQVEGEKKGRNTSGFQTGKGHGKGEDDEVSVSDLGVSPQAGPPPKGIVTLLLEIRGAKSLDKLVTRLSEIDGVVAVHAGDANSSSE